VVSDPGTSPTDLNTLLDAVLVAATAALDTIPGFAPGLEGAPARTFITDGQPALGCPQLTVNANPIREAATAPLGLGAGTRHRMDFRKNHVGVQVWITRCRPQDIPQNTANMTAHAEQHNADAWALWNYMWNINRPGSTDPIVSLCNEWFMDSIAPLQPSGDLSGWVLTVRVELAGYGDGQDP
jgi:hypothetical protein